MSGAGRTSVLGSLVRAKSRVNDSYFVVELAACLLVMAAAPGAEAAVDAGEDIPEVESLLSRARVELARPIPPDERIVVDRLRSVETWLRRALELAPRLYPARAMLGEVLLRRGRAEEAVSELERACALARGRAEVFPCSLRLAEVLARAGRYAESLREFDRHLEIGDAKVLPFVLVRSAEILMANGELERSEARFAQAVARFSDNAKEQDEWLVRALFGQAVLLDRMGRERDCRRILWRALALDPSRGQIDVAETPTGTPFLPAGEAWYYRGLALLVLGESRAALVAFQSFVDRARDSRFRKRAEDHLLGLVAAGADLPPPVTAKARVLAVATVEAQGPLPAPLIDAAWKARPRLLDDCLSDLPADAPRVLRVPIAIDIDGRGVPRRSVVQLGGQADFGVSGDWRGFAACVEKRIETGFRTVRAANMRRTSARLELVLAIGVKP